MAINFCTLTSSTVDAFCGARRQLVIDNLLEQKYPPAPGTNNGAVRAGTLPQIERQWRAENDIETKRFEFEQPEVTVTVEMFGVTGSETKNVLSQNLTFVSVTDFAVDGTTEINVNITEFGIEQS